MDHVVHEYGMKAGVASYMYMFVAGPLKVASCRLNIPLSMGHYVGVLLSRIVVGIPTFVHSRFADGL